MPQMFRFLFEISFAINEVFIQSFCRSFLRVAQPIRVDRCSCQGRYYGADPSSVQSEPSKVTIIQPSQLLFGLKAVTCVVREGLQYNISTKQLKVLLQYAEQDIFDLNRQACAFSLIRVS